jgi:hypothetical protein
MTSRKFEAYNKVHELADATEPGANPFRKELVNK